MKLCPACRRHLRSPEALCPFCGAEQRSEPDRSGSVMVGVLLSAVLVACGGDSPLDPGTGSSGTAGMGTTSGATTTVEPTTGSPSPMTGPDGTTVMPGPTTDGSTSTTGPGLDTGDEGCAFYAGCPPDIGLENVMQCDVFAQDCRPGEKCAAWGLGSNWTGTKCVPVTGDKQPGEPCTAEGGGISGIDDCQLGAMCWDVEGAAGNCVALCAGTPEAPVCAAGASCVITNNGVLNLCLPNCDPLVQDCMEGDVCVPIEGEFVCVFDGSDDLGAANDPCGFINGCDKGLFCLDTGTASAECMPAASGCCQPFCDVKAMEPPCPNPDQACVPWFDPMEEDVPPGLEDLGICSIPM